MTLVPNFGAGARMNRDVEAILDRIATLRPLDSSARREATEEVLQLLRLHLDLLAKVAVGGPLDWRGVHLEIVRCPWHEAISLLGARSRWSDPSANPWRAALTAIYETLISEAEANVLVRDAMQPPLWPRQGDPRIVSTVLADRGLLANDRVTIENRSEAWRFLCVLEEDAFNAIRWVVGRPGDLPGNPFIPLLDAYLLGYYPLDVRENHLCVIAPI
jgi:hypothetical protein